ncbi:hypothetical protein [Kineococcus sp. SYSU DK003]|uniref:hypothetical protein n=1 Tax=Kineococcus sp. SYSU DK003 TaxID=3383124 RepID=UPI003D7EAAD2
MEDLWKELEVVTVGMELSGRDDGAPPRYVQPARELEIVRPQDLEPRLGANLPVFGWISDPAFQVLRFVGLGAWIVLYAELSWVFGFLAMWAWIALNVAYENESRRRRRLRKHYRRAVRLGYAIPALPVEGPGEVSRELRGRRSTPRAAGAGAEPDRPVAPQVTAAEKALVATVRRVDTSDRFDRVDVVLVHQVADLLGPLLLRIAERGGDPQVRHDLETLAGEHLPRTVDDFLALPPDVARTSRNAGGTTPAEELRSQLHLLVEGCRTLRESVHAADVDRQQQQSRFLENKFRKSDLDL